MNDILKALSDPTRRRILILLRERSRSAGELADHFDLAKPTLSKHFAVLKDADLIYGEKTGTTIVYHLKASVLEEAMLGIMETLKIDPERKPSDDKRTTRRPAR